MRHPSELITRLVADRQADLRSGAVRRVGRSTPRRNLWRPARRQLPPT